MIAIEVVRLIFLSLCMLLMITVNVTYGVSIFRALAMVVIGVTSVLSVIKLVQLLIGDGN